MRKQATNAILVLSFLLSAPSAAPDDPPIPEFFGIYLVTESEEVIELKSYPTKVCYFHVPPSSNQDPLQQLMSGQNWITGALGAMNKPKSYIQLEKPPLEIAQENLKCFLVYGEYDIQSFFVDQFVPSAKFVPQGAQFIESDPQDARGTNSYFAKNSGWGIANESNYRYKKLAENCYYITLRMDSFNLAETTAYLGISLGTKRYWLFHYYQPLQKLKNLYEQQKYEETIHLAGKILKTSPDEGDAYLKRAYSFYYLKNYDKAVADANKVMELNPQNKYAYFLKSTCHYIQQDYLSALEDCKKLLTIDPDNVTARNMVGKIHFLNQDFQFAVDEFSAILQLDATNEDACYYRALCNYYLANYFLEHLSKIMSERGVEKSGLLFLGFPADALSPTCPI